MTFRNAFRSALVAASLLAAGAAQAQVTYIQHSDGRVTRVETHKDGSHTAVRNDGHWAADGGAGRSHDDYVRQHKDPGDRVVREPKAAEPRERVTRERGN